MNFSYFSDRSKRKHFDTATVSSKYRALNRTLDAIEKISISKRNLLNTVRGNGKCFAHFSSNTPYHANKKYTHKAHFILFVVSIKSYFEYSVETKILQMSLFIKTICRVVLFYLLKEIKQISLDLAYTHQVSYFSTLKQILNCSLLKNYVTFNKIMKI